MDECWLPVVDHEGLYEVSDHGRVRSIERTGLYAGRWKPTVMRFPAIDMAISTTRAGYKYVALKKPGGPSIKFLLHRLVMRAFAGEPPPKRPQVNHKDGCKSNNFLGNLEYCSAQENLLHLTRVLKRKRGGSGGYSKVTEEQARAIVGDPRILRLIAVDYGVTLQAIHLIKTGKNWAHLQGDELIGIKATYVNRLKATKEKV